MTGNSRSTMVATEHLIEVIHLFFFVGAASVHQVKMADLGIECARIRLGRIVPVFELKWSHAEKVIARQGRLGPS